MTHNLRQSWPVSRKAHICGKCKQTIEPGKKYWRLDGFYIDEAGEFVPECYKMHLDCWLPDISADSCIQTILDWGQQFGLTAHFEFIEGGTRDEILGEVCTVSIDDESHDLHWNYIQDQIPDRAAFLEWLEQQPSIPEFPFEAKEAS